MGDDKKGKKCTICGRIISGDGLSSVCSKSCADEYWQKEWKKNDEDENKGKELE